MRPSVTTTCTLAITVIAFSGCSMQPQADYSGLDLVDVSGTITLDGEPLPYAVVTFHSPDDGTFSYGMTDKSGHYSLQLDTEMSGITPGSKRVEVSTTRRIIGLNTDADGDSAEDREESDEEEWAVEFVPENYNKNSTLTAEVSSDATEFNFDLMSQTATTNGSSED